MAITQSTELNICQFGHLKINTNSRKKVKIQMKAKSSRRELATRKGVNPILGHSILFISIPLASWRITMGFKSMLCYRYSTTHENRLWNKLVKILDNNYSKCAKNIYLIGNLMVEGKELDALIVKEDALIVIDFKDYGGRLSISENQPWIASGIEINSDRKNPFLQLADNKYALLNMLKVRLPEGYENWINIGHINALVLFHQPIEYEPANLQRDLSPSASRWFNISDVDHVTETINEITSRQTSLRDERLEILLKTLGVADVLDAQQVDESLAKNPHLVESTDKIDLISAISSKQNQSDDNPSFSDIYYSKAKSMDSIKILIVGQDPYPTNANGVAFCKNSYYELYQEDCSGGIVLRSMGIDKERARKISKKNPKNLFYELLSSAGICFINVFNKSYDELSVEEIRKSALETHNFNMPLINKAKKIVLLGKGRTKSTFEEYYPDAKYDIVFIHPSPKAKIGNESEWNDTWETEKLATLLVD
jgi:uracil DNA glycosylase